MYSEIAISQQDSITVATVNWYSCSDLQHLLHNLRRKAYAPDKLRFIIIDNTCGADNELYSGFDNLHNLLIVKHDPAGLRGSYGHASGLDFAKNIIDTGWTLVLDPDVHIFLDEWDRILPKAITHSNAVSAGSPYPWWKLGKYHDFPSPIFNLYKTQDLLNIGIDWTPFHEFFLRKCWDFLGRQIVRLGPFATRKRLASSLLMKNLCHNLEKALWLCGPDTGYRIAQKARLLTLKALLFTPVDNCLEARQRYGLSEAMGDLAEDFELFIWQEIPVLAHRYSTQSYFWRMPRSNDMNHWWDTIEKAERGFFKESI